MCAFRSASKERSYAIEESEYEKEYEDEEYNSRYEEEISPNKPVVSFGDQQNPAGSFVVSLLKVKSKLMIMIRQRVKTRSTVSLTLPAYHLTRSRSTIQFMSQTQHWITMMKFQITQS